MFLTFSLTPTTMSRRFYMMRNRILRDVSSRLPIPSKMIPITQNNRCVSGVLSFSFVSMEMQRPSRKRNYHREPFHAGCTIHTRTSNGKNRSSRSVIVLGRLYHCAWWRSTRLYAWVLHTNNPNTGGQSWGKDDRESTGEIGLERFTC
jgi:hypothetical protein